MDKNDATKLDDSNNNCREYKDRQFEIVQSIQKSQNWAIYQDSTI